MEVFKVLDDGTECNTAGCGNFSVSGGKCHDCLQDASGLEPLYFCRNCQQRVICYTYPSCPRCRFAADYDDEAFLSWPADELKYWKGQLESKFLDDKQFNAKMEELKTEIKKEYSGCFDIPNLPTEELVQYIVVQIKKS